MPSAHARLWLLLPLSMLVAIVVRIFLHWDILGLDNRAYIAKNQEVFETLPLLPGSSLLDIRSRGYTNGDTVLSRIAWDEVIRFYTENLPDGWTVSIVDVRALEPVPSVQTHVPPSPPTSSEQALVPPRAPTVVPVGETIQSLSASRGHAVLRLGIAGQHAGDLIDGLAHEYRSASTTTGGLDTEIYHFTLSNPPNRVAHAPRPPALPGGLIPTARQLRIRRADGRRHPGLPLPRRPPPRR